MKTHKSQGVVRGLFSDSDRCTGGIRTGKVEVEGSDAVFFEVLRVRDAKNLYISDKKA
jgi:hypothetical protein